MTDKEALKMALEFIERVNKEGWILDDFEPQMYQAIAALKERLAQPEQEPVAWISPKGHIHFEPYLDSVPLYTHPPQRTEQEPVAHLWECLGRWSAYLVDNGERADCSPPSWLVDAVKNATAPPAQPAQRTWVDLSDEDIEECFTVTPDLYLKRHIAQRISAKLKEKNT